MTTFQKAFVLEAIATGMNTAKINKILQKKQHGAQNNRKLIADDKEITDQTQLECIREFYENLFKKREQKTTAEIKSFQVILILQNSLKMKQNFVRKI